MRNFSKTEAIRIITRAALGYEEHLKGRHFMLVYRQGGVLKTSVIDFRKTHFKHLTGAQSPIPAGQFFDLCIDRRLSESDFNFGDDGSMHRKLAVLHLLPGLFSDNNLIGDFIGSGIKISADYFVGGTKHFISLGCRYGKSTDTPVTLYCEDIRRLSYDPVKIIAVFRKYYNDTEYEDCTYLARGEDEAQLRQLLFSEN